MVKSLKLRIGSMLWINLGIRDENESYPHFIPNLSPIYTQSRLRIIYSHPVQLNYSPISTPL
jgi:hypothetical protein